MVMRRGRALRLHSAVEGFVAAQRAAAVGEDVSELLERIPATLKVIRLVRPKFACNHCERVVEGLLGERL